MLITRFFMAFLMICLPCLSACSPVTLGGKPADYYFKEHQVLELVLAVENEDVDKIARLAKSGVDLNYIGKKQVIPLLWGTHGHKWKGVKALLKHGADPNLPTVHDRSMTVWAAGSRYPDNLKDMLEHGADPNARDERGDTALIVAIDGNYIENVKLLVEAGAELHAEGVERSFSAQVAVRRGHYEIALYLLSKGASYKKQNTWGRVLAHSIHLKRYDKKKGKKELINWLRKRGVKIPFPKRPQEPVETLKGYEKDKKKWDAYMKFYSAYFDCFIGNRVCTEAEEQWYENYVKESKKKKKWNF